MGNFAKKGEERGAQRSCPPRGQRRDEERQDEAVTAALIHERNVAVGRG